MSLTTKRIVGLYLFLLLLLAFMGSSSQYFYNTHYDRLSEKETLSLELTDKRAEVFKRVGPDKVIAWAETHGMIPAASPIGALIVPAGAKPPFVKFEAASIEVNTKW